MKKLSTCFLIALIAILFYSCQSYPENKGKLTISNLSENENDKITESDKILSYDDNFRQSVYNDIDSLDFDSIEKVLKSQNKNAKYAYVQTSSYKVSLFSIIMMFISFSVLLFIYFSVIIKKGGRK